MINIGDGAFEECKSLREVSIPDNVASIGDYAFWNCQSLNQITVWSNVTSIGYSAFDGLQKSYDKSIQRQLCKSDMRWKMKYRLKKYNVQIVDKIKE